MKLLSRQILFSETCGMALAALAVCACGRSGDLESVVVGGDAGRGRAALIAYECGACHRIPGIPGARGNVGPPLDDFVERVNIAGRYANDPARLVDWIRHAPALKPQTAMPDLGVSEIEARDIAAYLYE
jgi:cytochrome c